MSLSRNNWVESYLDAIMTYSGTSPHDRPERFRFKPSAIHARGLLAGSSSGAGDESSNRLVSTRFFVRQIMEFKENELLRAWNKAKIARIKTTDNEARLENLSWRIWSIKRLKATRQAAELAGRRSRSRSFYAREAGPLSPGEVATPPSEREESCLSPVSEIATPREAMHGPPSPSVVGRDLSTAFEAAGWEAATESAAALGPGESEPWESAGGAGTPRASLEEDTASVRAYACPIPMCVCNAKPGASGAPPASAPPGVLSPRSTQFLDVTASGLASADAAALDSSAPPAPPPDRTLYVVLISMHGLVRGEEMELGRDADTGGQVKYVVELARALAQHPAVLRVDLLTRLVAAPEVDASYSVPTETLWDAGGGQARIVRLAAGPPSAYLRKEQLWPFLREFADRALEHALATAAALARSGRPAELLAVHGHYADAGECAALVSSTLGVPMVATGHSLGRNKLEHLLRGGMPRAEIETRYKISRRIEAEERTLDSAEVVFASTHQEVDEQWGVYDGYDLQLARALDTRRSGRLGRWMPTMEVIAPGLHLGGGGAPTPTPPAQSPAAAAPTRADHPASAFAAVSPRLTPPEESPVTLGLGGSPEGVTPAREPEIWEEISRFLVNPRKPAILALARPDAKKNFGTLLSAYGGCRPLRELANLVLFMGTRDALDELPASSQSVLHQVLGLIDDYDMYGSVAYPKHHSQDDVAHIYRFAAETRGVFVNAALQEPFGLTLIEAASQGVPTVATCNGGPVDIHRTLRNGVLVDPTDPAGLADACLLLVTSREQWERAARNGLQRLGAYTWASHCRRYVTAVEASRRRAEAPTVKRTLSDGGESLFLKAMEALAQSALAMGRTPSAPPGGPAHPGLTLGLPTGLTNPGSPGGGGAATDTVTQLSAARAKLVAVAAAASADPTDIEPGPGAPLSPTPTAAMPVGLTAVGGGCGTEDSIAGGGQTATGPLSRKSTAQQASPSRPSLARSSTPHPSVSATDVARTRALLVAAAANPPAPESAMALATAAAAALGGRADCAPRAARRTKLVLVAIEGADGRRGAAGASPRVTAAVLAALAASPPSVSSTVGVGILSVASLQQTRAALASGGVDLDSLDAISPAVGTELHLFHAGPLGSESPVGAWRRCEDFDAAAAFRWSRADVQSGAIRASIGLASGQSDKGGRPSPALALEPPPGEEETGAWTARVRLRPAGVATAWSLSQTARLRRRLRARGYRCNLVAEANGYYLHALPVRAGRALAGRWLAARAGVPLSAVTVVMCDPEPDGDADGLVEGLPSVLLLGGTYNTLACARGGTTLGHPAHHETSHEGHTDQGPAVPTSRHTGLDLIYRPTPPPVAPVKPTAPAGDEVLESHVAAANAGRVVRAPLPESPSDLEAIISAALRHFNVLPEPAVPDGPIAE